MSDEANRFARRHLAFGWWTILAYLSLGIGLEAAAQLAIEGYGRVIVCARTPEKAAASLTDLERRHAAVRRGLNGGDHFVPRGRGS